MTYGISQFIIASWFSKAMAQFTTFHVTFLEIRVTVLLNLLITDIMLLKLSLILSNASIKSIIMMWYSSDGV